ncbi:DUF6262 family protein [Shimazuella soli]|uniref:DUF6262 family protein n=1 Tax=Shimazuella soli TaxID=1892854 RepID=UPI001F0F4789|nr:DUF6262 family protein [Shimazuella soli]
MTLKRNIEGMKQFARQKSIDASLKVDNAIQQLIRNKESINFNNVAKIAKVSKSYLYNQKEIRSRIEQLRNQQDRRSLPVVKQNMTDHSKDVLLAAKNKRIKLLEEENQRLKNELKLLRGKVYDSL